MSIISLPPTYSLSPSPLRDECPTQKPPPLHAPPPPRRKKNSYKKRIKRQTLKVYRKTN
ncbi:hypothetical protein L873DRAFT_459907 [Choiromyces venosus 120613-1]|uniref:Uncharacterized protein n=1 Tax=Choiromyces venosus 120613-1 TaxID=1336337 RepID=A0A3N4JVL3_9PEZI|nr:hypothetical protein L873DRAFT_459907 [Choiromyces venosus 120613-1]